MVNYKHEVKFVITLNENSLCLIGLTDKMRADYHIMKDLSNHTRLTPDQREGRLNRFITNIQK